MAINQINGPGFVNQGESIELELNFKSEKTFDSLETLTLYVLSDDGFVNDKFLLKKAKAEKHERPRLEFVTSKPDSNKLKAEPCSFTRTDCLTITLTGNLNTGCYRLAGSILLNSIRVPLLESKIEIIAPPVGAGSKATGSSKGQTPPTVSTP